jgi:hypothetical protein
LCSLSQPATIGLASQCNAPCHCNTDVFKPVCDENRTLYFSPCHAGCTYHIAQGVVGVFFLEFYLIFFFLTFPLVYGDFLQFLPCIIQGSLHPINIGKISGIIPKYGQDRAGRAFDCWYLFIYLFEYLYNAYSCSVCKL